MTTHEIFIEADIVVSTIAGNLNVSGVFASFGPAIRSGELDSAHVEHVIELIAADLRLMARNHSSQPCDFRDRSVS